MLEDEFAVRLRVVIANPAVGFSNNLVSDDQRVRDQGSIGVVVRHEIYLLPDP